jgi:hypothetical protein
MSAVSFHASGGSKWDFVRRPGRRGRVGDDVPWRPRYYLRRVSRFEPRKEDLACGFGL